ncbi:S-layer homology domain-containing protein [Candidatus Margulisiibacteriota bacterium]
MKRLLVIGCLLLVISAADAMVDIGEIGVGARPLGLGKATVSGMDDASSIFTNPAGLALNYDLNIISMNGTLMSDVNYFLIGIANTAPIGRVGIGYLNASLGAIPITQLSGSGSTAAVVQTGTTDYSSSIIFLTYGTRLSRLLRGRADNVSFGFSLKYFLQGFSGGGVSMQDATGVGMDADLGFLWQVNPWARLGLKLVNFVPASFGGRFIWEKNNLTESLPLTLKVGSCINIYGRSAIRASDRELRLLLDYENQSNSGRPAVWHAGLEYWPIDILAFRVGLDQKPKASEAGIGVDNNMTAGVGLKYLGFTFDYAYHQFGDLSENTTHFFSIGYRGIDDLVGYPQWRRRGGIPAPEVVPKPFLTTFTDLPDDYWAKKPVEYMASLGIMGGYSDQTFRPNNALSRGELAVILVKAKGFQVDSRAKSPFGDVENWLRPYVAKAVERNYMRGYAGSRFKPSQGITRSEAAVVFARYAGLYVKPTVTHDVFPDVSKRYWAAPSISACKLAGFFEYLSGKYFGPNETLTRAEVAEVLSKMPFVKEQIKDLISGDG